MLITIVRVILALSQVLIALAFAALALVLFEEQALRRYWNPAIRVPWWTALVISVFFFLGTYFLLSN